MGPSSGKARGKVRVIEVRLAGGQIGKYGMYVMAILKSQYNDACDYSALFWLSMGISPFTALDSWNGVDVSRLREGCR
jgi:hypothetical protein